MWINKKSKWNIVANSKCSSIHRWMCVNYNTSQWRNRAILQCSQAQFAIFFCNCSLSLFLSFLFHSITFNCRSVLHFFFSFSSHNVFLVLLCSCSFALFGETSKLIAFSRIITIGKSMLAKWIACRVSASAESREKNYCASRWIGNGRYWIWLCAQSFAVLTNRHSLLAANATVYFVILCHAVAVPRSASIVSA